MAVVGMAVVGVAVVSEAVVSGGEGIVHQNDITFVEREFLGLDSSVVVQTSQEQTVLTLLHARCILCASCVLCRIVLHKQVQRPFDLMQHLGSDRL